MVDLIKEELKGYELILEMRNGWKVAENEDERRVSRYTRRIDGFYTWKIQQNSQQDE